MRGQHHRAVLEFLARQQTRPLQARSSRRTCYSRARKSIRGRSKLGFAFPVLASWKDSLDGGDAYSSPRALVFSTRRGGSNKVVLRVERLSERLRRSAALHDEAALHHDKAAEYW